MSAILALDQNVVPLVRSEPLLSAKNRAYRKWFIDQEAANDGFDLVDKCTQGQPIHMNGRVFDPTIARFLQADPFIQSPSNLQSYNRYSYTWNNPLRYTDPSGYFVKWLKREAKRAFRSVKRLTKTFFHSPRQFIRDVYQTKLESRRNLFRKKWVQQVASIATFAFGPYQPLCAAGVNASVADAYGASPGDALQAGARAGIASYINQVAGGANRGGNAYGGNLFEEAVIQGTAYGAGSEITGGKFSDGFKMGFGGRYLRAGIDAFTGFAATWAGAEKGPTFKAPVATPECPMIDVCDPAAMNAGSVRSGLWGDMHGPGRVGETVPPALRTGVHEGSSLMGALSTYAPGFNSGAVLHDRFVGSLQRSIGLDGWYKPLKIAGGLVTNQMTIPHVIALNYVGLGAGTNNRYTKDLRSTY